MGFDPYLLARRTADKAHRSIGQVRKGSGAPYITHCEGVAHLVQEAGGTHSMIEAAYLQLSFESGPWSCVSNTSSNWVCQSIHRTPRIFDNGTTGEHQQYA